MSFKNVLFLSLTAVAILFSSCNNDDENNNNFTEEDLSTNAWLVTSIESNLDEQATVIANALPAEITDFLGGPEFFAALLIAANADIETIEACEGDDSYTFATSGSIEFDNGGTLCEDSTEEDEDSAFVLPATWTLADGDQLTITDGDGDATVSTILTLNSSTLVMESRANFSDPELGIETDQEIVITISFAAK